MARQMLDISDLPDEARESLQDYYDYLRERYGEQSDEAGKFDPTDFRGAIDVDRRKAEERLNRLREEWDRAE